MIFEVTNSIKIGSFTITFYALAILIGVILAVFLAAREAKRIGIASDDLYTGIIIILPLSVIGARIWYVLFNINDFPDFASVIGFRNGSFTGLAGLAIQGGILVAIISVYIYCKIKKISLFKILDLVAPGFLIGQICGRWGNFFNQELYGPIIGDGWYKDLISNLPLFKDYMLINGAYRHPVFLYESLLNLVGFIFIMVGRRKIKAIKCGDLIGIYLVWYGIVRIFTESLRLNSGVSEPLMIGGVSVSILLSIIFIVVGIIYLVLKRILPKIVKEPKEPNYTDNKFKNVFIAIKYNILYDFHNTPTKSYIDVVDSVKENKIDTVLFDNDGTLLDTKRLIDDSFIHTFKEFFPDKVLTDEELDSFFGPTLYQTFSKYADNEEDINKMIECYRAFNIPNHDNYVTAFPNAKSTLKTLHKKGYKIGVVSSKKTDLLRHGLDICGLLPYIDVVIGADEVKNHKPAPDGILKAMEELGSKNAMYVGDTLFDMDAAKAAHVKAIGVLYNNSHPEVMLKAKPDNVINDLNELIKICGE